MPDTHTNTKAEARWDRANHAYQHYLNYINRQKPDKLALSFTDLVYIKNFKGGSTIIGEAPHTLSSKLKHYELALRQAAGTPAFQRSLKDLDDNEFATVREQTVAFAELSQLDVADINGFGVSFASALLHFYFPESVPILDRRALSGAAIEGIEVDAQNQGTNLLEQYPALIDPIRRRLRADPKLTLRSLDRFLFIQELRRPPFRAKDDG